MYVNGEGVPEDYVQAYAWFTLSAAQGNEKARIDKTKIAEEMTSSQIAQAQQLSKTFAKNVKRNRSIPQQSRPSGLSRAVVKEAQQLLATLGYRPGSADGLIGRKTRAAICVFQSDLEMTATGVITNELLSLLRFAVKAADSKQSQ